MPYINFSIPTELSRTVKLARIGNHDCCSPIQLIFSAGERFFVWKFRPSHPKFQVNKTKS
jgi:hypothetical protein